MREHEPAVLFVDPCGGAGARRWRREMPATIRADEMVGRWGLASFQNPKDRARTEAAAQGRSASSPM